MRQQFGNDKKCFILYELLQLQHRGKSYVTAIADIMSSNGHHVNMLSDSMFTEGCLTDRLLTYHLTRHKQHVRRQYVDNILAN